MREMLYILDKVEGWLLTYTTRLFYCRAVLLYPNMIDLCQWRAAIGLWNCRSTSKSQVHAVQTRCSKEENNEISHSCLRSTTGSSATTQSGHIFAVSDESDSALNIKRNESHFFATTDDDFVCFFLWLFLHILLLLSGDIELNPGPVTDVLKEGRKIES